ncbi:hypothetical protein C0V97_00940 [Asaia sp. W19]|uniref:hypothetical protein n=1 Tax=unclassified Asaia TaxID=2685023 RepID=UPI000F8E5DAA|nr:hypothetical protein [Asaia sp. W19]RUT27365.1 hypothetical protein C0V97_00940 [Asaia sp. W19]
MIRTAYYTKMDFQPCEAGVLGIVVEFEETDLPDMFKVYIAEGLYLDFERWSSDRTYRATTPSAWNVHRDQIQPIRRDSGRKATNANPNDPQVNGGEGTALQRHLRAMRADAEIHEAARLIGKALASLGRSGAQNAELPSRLERMTAELMTAVVLDLSHKSLPVEPAGLRLNAEAVRKHLAALHEADARRDNFADRSVKDAVKGKTGLEDPSEGRSRHWAELWAEGQPRGHMVASEGAPDALLKELRVFVDQALAGKITFGEFQAKFNELAFSWRGA